MIKIKVLMWIIILYCACCIPCIKKYEFQEEYYKICNICKSKTTAEQLKIKIYTDSLGNRQLKYVCSKCSDSLNLETYYISEYLNLDEK